MRLAAKYLAPASKKFELIIDTVDWIAFVRACRLGLNARPSGWRNGLFSRRLIA
ncbi:hypothetical protein HCU64_06070 [Methylobacterium sp. C25]|uniref:hypothetical protein n=1 Tax=Methylobacterium sp. C25 TaxID=2721622 RepID=UPI001F28E520|nr:hypothetical protein [Methylobacterium sp. C25]MCE4223310.1 hypothetical protein [Methylobacterium sp. C25]